MKIQKAFKSIELFKAFLCLRYVRGFSVEVV